MRKKEWWEFPKRWCYTLHTCAVCKERITMGQQYYDGVHRKSHIECASPNNPLNPTTKESVSEEV